MSTGGVVASLLASLVLVGSPAGATPGGSNATPTVDSVRKQLDALARKNSQLVDQYDGVQIKVQERTAAARRAALASTAAQQRYSAAHHKLVELMQAQYMGSNLGAAGALLDSNSSGNYLDRLDLINISAMQSAEVVKTTTAAKSAAARAANAAASALSAVKAEKTTLAAQKVAVEKQISTYKATLARLTAQQRAALLKAQQQRDREAAAAAAGSSTSATSSKSSKHKSGGTNLPVVTASGTASAQAMKAANFAIAQVGKPYVYGADGPGSYDCSGLAMASWRSAGVSLPHNAAAQYGYGHHISLSQLQPGDLVFYYHPIGHVSIYIGHGTLVSAPQPGENVKYVSLKSTLGDFTGATRIR